MKYFGFLTTGMALVTCSLQGLQAQELPADSGFRMRTLDSVTITSFLRQNLPAQLPDTRGTFIFSGKKSESVSLREIPADLTNKIGRQLFAKIPGVFVYDMDGAGNQVNVAARGLDPHRGWEFNIRRGGIITNSDMYGYPASHFSMPMESVERIELVRGTASLQYGAQFGGMLNYVPKEGDSSRPFSFESINTAGSFKLLSTFNAIGGSIGKWKYYAYFQRKSRDGYRDYEHTDSESEGVSLVYAPNTRFSLKVDWARSEYIYRMPGQLTDSEFHDNPKQASRTRNYFNPDIHVPSVNLNWQLAPRTQLQVITSAVLGIRNSVMFDKPANVHDTINTATGQYNNRQIDIDRFHSYTAEARILQEYNLGRMPGTLTAGLQYMHNDLHRTQQGVGSTGSDFDMTLVKPGFGRNVHLITKNIALYAENRFQLSRTFSVNLGTRVEIGRTDMSGNIVYYPEDQLPVAIQHQFPLFGLNFSYKPFSSSEFYGGISQAYRPMLFKDLIPSSTYEKVDPNIQDSRGYNAELGWRGNFGDFRWDVTGFLLGYNKKFGMLSETDENGDYYTYRTNIGDALTAGLEVFLQKDWRLSNHSALSIFTSTSFMHARYTNATVKSGNDNIDIRGNRVESAPDLITRNGISFRWRQLSLSGSYHYTSKTYADALNTEVAPPATGAVGLVPSYGLVDVFAGYRLTRNLAFRLQVSNLTNKQYFTKRPAFYPGPGIWPSDGRNASFTLEIKL